MNNPKTDKIIAYFPRHQLCIEQEEVQLRRELDPHALKLPTNVSLDELEEMSIFKPPADAGDIDWRAWDDML
jgi:hypothetical protein